MKDGWHCIFGVMTYIKANKVMKGIKDGKTVYPYRTCKAGGYSEAVGVKYGTFKNGYNKRYFWF